MTLRFTISPLGQVIIKGQLHEDNMEFCHTIKCRPCQTQLLAIEGPEMAAAQRSSAKVQSALEERKPWLNTNGAYRVNRQVEG